MRVLSPESLLMSLPTRKRAIPSLTRKGAAVPHRLWSVADRGGAHNGLGAKGANGSRGADGRQSRLPLAV